MITKSITKAGTPIRNYWSVHKWLISNYGSADLCENREQQILEFECSGTISIFQWAKKKRVLYRKERSNFLKLCRSCHSKLDKCGQKNKGINHPAYGKPAHNKIADFCQIEGCNNKYKARGMCNSHYMKKYHGKFKKS